MNIDFNEIKEKILPFFIEVYGSEYKDLIIDRMDKIAPIFYTTLENTKHTVYKLENAKKIELTLRFLKDMGINLPENVIEEIKKSTSTFKLSEYPEATKLLDLCFGRNEYTDAPWDAITSIVQEPTTNTYEIRKSINILQKLGITVNEEDYNNWLTTKEAEITFQKIKPYITYIEQLNEEYKAFTDTLKAQKALMEKGDELNRTLILYRILKRNKTIYE